MTETPVTTPLTMLGEVEHHHDRHCYWDHMRCGWVCAQRPPHPNSATEPSEPATAKPEPVAAHSF